MGHWTPWSVLLLSLFCLCRRIKFKQICSSFLFSFSLYSRLILEDYFWASALRSKVVYIFFLFFCQRKRVCKQKNNDDQTKMWSAVKMMMMIVVKVVKVVDVWLFKKNNVFGIFGLLFLKLQWISERDLKKKKKKRIKF